jgi:hypothetical protein
MNAMTINNEPGNAAKAIDRATNELLDAYRELAHEVEQQFTPEALRDRCGEIKKLEQALSKAICEPMRLTIEIPYALIESVVKSTMENYPEASSSNTLQCTSFRYHGDLSLWRFEFHDSEDDKHYVIGKKELLAAFPLIFTDKWPKGCVPPPCSNDPEAWDRWLGDCDNVSHDAFAQLACLGEVIYG